MGAEVPGTADVDRFIAKRILAGDEKVFRELFDSFYPRLFRFAFARLNGDREAASNSKLTPMTVAWTSMPKRFITCQFYRRRALSGAFERCQTTTIAWHH
jgi:hypothetical protein